MTPKLRVIAPQENLIHRVLIVEDEPALADVLQRTLQRSGFEAEIALDGRTAASLIKELSPAVMTLDLQMPHMNGMDLLKLIRSNPEFNNIKILIVSAMTDAQLQEAMNAGADGALAKPFRTSVLIERIARLINPTAENKIGQELGEAA